VPVQRFHHALRELGDETRDLAIEDILTRRVLRRLRLIEPPDHRRQSSCRASDRATERRSR
jgi:hypothetical protein